MGSFVFRWPYPAKDVHVTGTFDDWGKTEALNQVGDHWEKEVQLPFADKKIMYKFVVDDQWIVDENAPKEDDGHNNVNNVLLPEQIKKTESSTTEPPASPGHRVIAYSSSPPGTNAEGASADAPTFSAPQNGAPTLTRSESEANAARWVPHVAADPDRPVTRELSSSDIPGGFPETPAAELDQMKVDPLPASGHANTQTSVTTSKEDYENAGGEGTAATGLGVAPLPASGHSDIQSSVTTSKEDYDNAGGEGAAAGSVSAQPIPATGHEDIQSSVTTTKEEYEKGGLVAAAGAAATGAGIALKSAFSKPSGDDKNIIPESSLPMNPEKTDTLDAGPFVSSSGPGTTTADLAAKVPLEPKREAQIVDDSSTTPFLNSSGPGTTTADLASHVPLAQARQGLETGAATDANVATGVPDVVKESIQAAHASPEAAASPEIVAEKSALEKELASKVTPSQATGEPASASAQQTSYYGLATSVPAPVEESMKAAHASPEAAADASAVAEKSALERELAAKVPVAEGAGEPAPTIAAATSTAAPAATSPSTSAAAAATSITDGTTANEPLPGTDTSTTSTGPVAGAIAGGAVVAGSAAAAATVAAHRHEDGDAEPSRVADSTKPDVTNDLTKDQTKVSGVAPSAAAQVSDGADASDVEVPRTTAPVEKTEATATEYAPPREASAQPGVSRTAPAAMLDGTEDPTLMEEPAVQMMAQNDKEDVTATGAPAHDATTTNATDAAPAAAAATSSSIAAPATPKKEATTTTPATTETPKKDTPATPSKNTTASPAGASTTSTPAKNGTPSRTDSTTEDGKKKKRHRISAMFKKIFD